jgi:hypothetical protein
LHSRKEVRRMADIKDLLSDPEPIDENDVEIRHEVFAIHHAMGKKPEDLVGATPEIRKEYAKWLESQRA